MLLELAIVALEPQGYEVVTFRDPQTALKAFSESNPPPDLLITDYAMHTMTGLDLIHECKSMRPTQRIIMLSGTVDASIYENSAVKPDRFLSKPYQARELTELVQAVLNR